MKTYTITKAFKAIPFSLSFEPLDTIIKYEEVIAVVTQGITITDVTFYAWIGSLSSASYMELTSTTADDGNVGGLTPITEPYTTTDLVNRINSLITKVNS